MHHTQTYCEINYNIDQLFLRTLAAGRSVITTATGENRKISIGGIPPWVEPKRIVLMAVDPSEHAEYAFNCELK